MKSLLGAPVMAGLVVAGLVVGACAPEAVPEEPTEVEQVRMARETLGDPLLRLAAALVRTAELVDAVRHEVPRGEGMGRAAAAAGREAAALREAAEEAAAAGEEALAMQGRPGEAAWILTDAAGLGMAAAEAAERETAMLEHLSAVDVELDEAVRQWDAPGSQTERRETLAAQATVMLALADELRALTPVPPECTRLRDNRVRWAELVAERSSRLADTATAGRGATYDELREAFRRNPFAEDRTVADAADAGCWTAASDLARAAAIIDGHLEELEQALS